MFKLNECVVSIESHLIDGRSRLIEDLQGERHKLVTRDGNAIDCISVDRRGRYVSNMFTCVSDDCYVALHMLTLSFHL